VCYFLWFGDCRNLYKLCYNSIAFDFLHKADLLEINQLYKICFKYSPFSIIFFEDFSLVVEEVINNLEKYFDRVL